ncbi:hypothetical protein [uncultured Clostridium sp.]|uniref:hypothetical protein n=1 Tax=uncultured Clostridium sp. TaxID=59620 RepID=UPI00345B7D3B
MGCIEYINAPDNLALDKSVDFKEPLAWHTDLFFKSNFEISLSTIEMISSDVVMNNISLSLIIFS